MGASRKQLQVQINKLADYFLKKWPEQIKEGGTVDNALRVIKELRNGHTKILSVPRGASYLGPRENAMLRISRKALGQE